MRTATFWLRLGGWLLLAVGPAHLAGHLADRGTLPANATEAQLFALLREYKFHVMGLDRSLQNFLDGFSLSFAVLSFLAGLLVLRAAAHAPSAPALVRDLAIAGAGASAVLAITNLIYTIPPPAVMFGLASLAFVAAIVTSPAARRG